MYYTLCKLFGVLCCSERHIWMDVELRAETRKAILVQFDNRQAWFPKAWIIAVKAEKRSGVPVIASGTSRREAICYVKCQTKTT